MSYAYHVYPDENLVFVVAAGQVAGADVIEASARMFEDPGWRVGIDQLCDFRAVLGVAVTLDDMKGILELERRYEDRIGPGRQALVVRTELHESLCRLYAAMSRLRRRPQEIRVFRVLEEAMAWIGLEALPALPPTATDERPAA